jgi:hypothetical protein
MKLSLLFTTLFTSLIMVAPSTANSPLPDLSGPVTRSDLEKPGYPWLKSGEKAANLEYQKHGAEIKKLSKRLIGTDIEIYFGTWCGDSHEHVPSFLALLDTAAKEEKASPLSLKLFAIPLKRTYPGYTNPRKIERYPTFVFLRGGKEIGRIVETPKKSILSDTAIILE